MKNIRIGNNISFVWSINRLGQPEKLDKNKCEVILSDSMGNRCVIDDLEISGNSISGVFRGNRQKIKGEYDLTLISNRGKSDQFIVDEIKCWNLVAHSNMVYGPDMDGLITEPLSIESELNVAANGKDGHTPVITTAKFETKVVIYADNKIIGEINDGRTPKITTKKVDDTYYIYVDDNLVAQVKDGADGRDYVLTENDKSQIADICKTRISVPTKTSQLTNDSGFITQHQDISGKQDKLSATQLANLNADHSKYVTKETGKGLSTNDYTNEDKTKVAAALTQHQDISGKVDKVAGKGLSTNDYTNDDKAKVEAALTQHQDISGKVDKVAGKGLSSNDYTDEDKTKVAAALTQHQDISGKQDKLSATQLANLNADHSKYVTKVTGKGLSTNDYTNADKSAVQNIESLSTNQGTLASLNTTAKNNLVASINEVKGIADSKVSPSAISDMETKTHASTTYQAKGSYMADTPSGDPMHYAYTNIGAVWNDTTKYWEYNELIDINNIQMQDIYKISQTLISSYAFVGVKARTYKTPNTTPTYLYNSFPAISNCFRDSRLETINIQCNSKSYRLRVNQFSYVFLYCGDLRTIIGEIDVNYISSFDNPFGGCNSLQSVNIYGLKASIKFANSPNLSKASILYMIQKATNTTDITITLHPTAKSMADADEDIQAAIQANGHIELIS